jgi:hypothetical protein
MTSPAISDEINRHVEAVLALSKRDILLRLLQQAERCARLEDVRAAAILAEVALEEVFLLADPAVLGTDERRLEIWRELRNRAGARAVDNKAVEEMLAAVRMMLEQIDVRQGRSTPLRPVESEFTKIRGKYASVLTSVDDFLKRKHEDLELENLE